MVYKTAPKNYFLKLLIFKIIIPRKIVAENNLPKN